MSVRQSWRVGWLSLRNRWLSSRRFQYWAARLPVTRWVARRRARRLFDLCAGFVYSQVLLACVRLELLEILRNGPQTADGLATRVAVPRPALERLLGAATALRLLDCVGGERYALGPDGAALLANPGIAAMIEHHPHLYADLADPVALLRAETGPTRLGRYWPYARAADPSGLGDDQVATYSQLMSASQTLIAGQVLDAYALDRHRCLLDVGGGEGTFLASVAERVPGLRLVLFDLPAVAERARARFATQGLAGRAQVVGGDFRSEPLPKGADVVSLVRVVHDQDDAEALQLLRRVREALPDGGVLLVAEPMAGTAGAEPIGDAYFAFYLWAMGSGRARRPAELAALLERAGFDDPRLLHTSMPLQVQVMVASAGDA